MTQRILAFYLIINFCYFQKIDAQEKTGKALYEISAIQGKKQLEMIFTSQKYIYSYKDNVTQKSISLKSESIKGSQDSADLLQKSKLFKEQLMKDPIQYWFGNLASDEVLYTSYDNSLKRYCVKDTLKFITWTLEQDTAILMQQKCQKAIGNYNGAKYEAWYATSIPVSVAPLQFRGLPGLLLKVTNLNSKTSVTLVNLEWPIKENFKIEPCKEQTISKYEMQEIIRKLNQEILNMRELNQKQKKNN